MDYSPIINMFWKWQWDILRKNIGVVGDGQEEEKEEET
jgi:hypothetical protein